DYVLFYRPLGTSPEEVGLTQSDTIGQSALAIFVLAVPLVGIIGLIFLVGMAFLWVVGRWRRFKPERPEDPFVSQIDVFRAQIRMHQGGLPIPAHYQKTVPAAILDQTARQVAQAEKDARSNAIFRLLWYLMSLGYVRPARLFLLFMLWGMSLGVTVSVLTLADYSSSLAARVQSGYSVEPALFGTFSLPTTARIATVKTMSGDALASIGSDCLMYLGEANGTIVVYDASRD